MGEIQEIIKEIKEKIEVLKKRSEIQERLKEIRKRIEKLENEPGKRKSLDGCYDYDYDIEKGEVKWPSFQEWF
ncbi:hypothetical protein ES703_11196 [subsurface metagenome]